MGFDSLFVNNKELLKALTITDLTKPPTPEYARALSTLTNKRLGTGSTRVVYEFEGKALKLAYGRELQYASEMNRDEWEMFQCLGTSYAPKLYAHSPTWNWILVEAAKPFEDVQDHEQLLVKLLNLTPEELKVIQQKGAVPLFNPSPRFKEEFPEFIPVIKSVYRKSSWYRSLLQKLKQCNVYAGDLGYGNMGTRTGNDLIVIDAGFKGAEHEPATYMNENLNEESEDINVLTPFSSLRELIEGYKTAAREIFSLKKREQKTVEQTERIISNFFAQAKPKFKFLGSGMDRMVFQLPGKKAIKFRVFHRNSFTKLNPQEDIELKAMRCLGEKYAPKIYATDPENYDWVIVEEVNLFDSNNGNEIKEVNERLIRLLNLSKEELSLIEQNYETPLSTFILSPLSRSNREMVGVKFKENEWYRGFIRGILKCEVSLIDFWPNNLGYRGADDLLFIDLGIKARKDVENDFKFYGMIDEGFTCLTQTCSWDSV